LAGENGTKIKNGALLKKQAAIIESGDEITIGRTRFRLYLGDHPVKPTQQIGFFTISSQLVERGSVAFLLTLFAIAGIVWADYVGHPGPKYWESSWIAPITGYLTLALFYSGLLGIFNYYKYKNIYFRRNLAVFNLAAYLVMIIDYYEPYMKFLLMGSVAQTIIGILSIFVILTGVMSLNVRMTKNALGKKDLAYITGIALIITILSLVDNFTSDKFSSHPRYPGTLVPNVEPSDPVKFDTFIEESTKEIFQHDEE
jgi:hypothetical protein